MSEKREVVVNENDEVIGAKYWYDMQPTDIKRSSSAWIITKKNGFFLVLIQQRKWTKISNPGKWSSSVSGTLEEGETYESNIYKEAAEEIGLVNVKFTPMHDKPKRAPGKFYMRYIAIGDYKLSDFTPQESEVEALDFVEINDLLRDTTDNPDRYNLNFHDRVVELKNYLEKTDEQV